MTAMFDLGAPEMTDAARAQRVLDEAKADHAFSLALDHCRQLGGRSALRRLARYRSQIAAVEAEIVAEHVHDDGNTRRAERMLADGRTSKREQRRKANRAKAVSKNKDLASKLASNEMSEEQFDVIADASAKTDGDAATDTELIDKVASMPPEQGRTAADDWIAKRATADGVQTEYDRQRKLRRASKFHNKNKGLDAISIEGDGVATKAMWDAIDRRADELYKADGDRDLPNAKHPRTRDQRKFDAVYELICGTKVDNNVRPPTTASSTGANEWPQGSSQPVNSTRYTPRSARPRVVIGLTIDKLIGRDPATVAAQHGLGLIPDSVLVDYAANADIMAALFDRDGQPLWLGRLHRYATQTQMIALILRDRHCVLCGVDHTRCQAHHTMPWNAPGNGRTDLDNLALLCGPCHTKLHADNRTIYQDHDRTWRTRPATPNESPPPRLINTRNQVRQE